MILSFLASCESRNEDPAVPEMLSPQKTTGISHDIMVNPYITMNWGENGNDNGVTYNPNAISWVSNRTDYNRGHVIYVRSDIR